MADPLLNLDDYLKPPAAAEPASVVKPAGAAYKGGKLLGKAARFGAKVAPVLAGAEQLITGVTDAITQGPSLSSAVRAGVGAASTFSPQARLVATGMSAANLIPDSAYNSVLGITETDIAGPATKAFIARGGMTQPPAQETVADRTDAAQGAVLRGTIPGTWHPAEAAPKLPSTLPVAPATWQPGALPGDNTLAERYGVRGIGGIGGIGNTEVVGSPQTMNNVGNIAGNFVGALTGLKQISGDNAQRLAQQKAASAALAAKGTYARGAAAQTTAQLSQQLAAEHLKKNPGDLSGAAAILHGRSTGSGMKPTIPMGGVGMNPAKDPSLVFDPATQTTKLVYPTQNITLAQAVASAKKNGTYKSDEQVKRDLAANPRFKLVE